MGLLRVLAYTVTLCTVGAVVVWNIAGRMARIQDASFPAEGQAATFVVDAFPRPLANITCRFPIEAWSDLGMLMLPDMVEATDATAYTCAESRMAWFRWLGLHADPTTTPCPKTPLSIPQGKKRMFRFRSATCTETSGDVDVLRMYFESETPFWKAPWDHAMWTRIIPEFLFGSFVLTVVMCVVVSIVWYIMTWFPKPAPAKTIPASILKNIAPTE